VRRLYQTNWHGIPFSDFSRQSAWKIADGTFYSAFYKKFFERFSDWESLDHKWLAQKEAFSKFILGRIASSSAATLAVGCGLGAIERALLASGNVGLDVQEVTDTPLLWLKPLIPKEQIHIGFFPQCLPPGKKYDLIYLSAVDYCFDEKSWIDFLKSVRAVLRPGGRCLVISVTFYGSFNGKSDLSELSSTLRYPLSLIKQHLLKNGESQFWGYKRTQRDYQRSFQHAGFTKIIDGLLPDGMYWIEGNL